MAACVFPALVDGIRQGVERAARYPRLNDGSGDFVVMRTVNCLHWQSLMKTDNADIITDMYCLFEVGLLIEIILHRRARRRPKAKGKKNVEMARMIDGGTPGPRG